MTQTIGCVGGANEESRFKKLSDAEIVDKFNDFITMFPTEDLTVLYDKEGGKLSTDVDAISEDIEKNQSETQNSEEEDKGTWVISSYLDTEKEGTIGVVLRFNRNTREAQGDFILMKDEEEKEYPVYYDENEIHLVNSDIPEYVKQKFDNFKMMYEFIEVDRTYLDNLESTKIMYNPNVPIFDAHYKLESNDKNIKNIKKVYPGLIIDENSISLELEGSGTPWRTTSRVGMRFLLGKKEYLSSYMSFDNSLESEIGIDEP